MDSDNIVAADGADRTHENDFTKELMSTLEHGPSDTLNGSVCETVEINAENANSVSYSNSDDGRLFEEVTGETHRMESDCSTACKEAQVGNADNSKRAISQKVHAQVKSEKPFSGMNVTSVSVKKSKDGLNVEAKAAASNGSVDLKSESKQCVKSGKLGDRRPHVKKPGKSDAAPGDGIREETKLKNLKKGSHEKHEADAQTSISPREGDGDSKPQRLGGLLNYGFNFKCNERAEKRKEFYSKLEEKIHVKELEKSDLQAKSKETQEAEIKMFRKSLNFKAIPIPSFYQEPQPPKVELKKIPPTRPKSPKLGRKKTVPALISDRDGNQISHPGRLSLDQKVSNSKSVVKGTPPVDSMKSQLKSLPRLPSQKTALSDGKNEDENVPAKAAASAKAKTERKKTVKDVDTIIDSNPAHESIIPAPYQEPIPSSEPTDAQTNADVPSRSGQEGKFPVVLEPVAVEH